MCMISVLLLLLQITHLQKVLEAVVAVPAVWEVKEKVWTSDFFFFFVIYKHD